MTGTELVNVVRSRGCYDASDPRDAAHEAFHALTVQLRGRWHRRAINEALKRHYLGNRGGIWVHELEARIVEREVSKRLGFKSGYSFEAWITIAVEEAVYFNLPHTGFDRAMRTVRTLERLGRHEVGAERVLRWAERAVGRKRRGQG